MLISVQVTSQLR